MARTRKIKKGVRHGPLFLILTGLLAGGTGCRWIFKPSYPAKTVAQSLMKLCAKEHIPVQARRQDDNLQAFFWWQSGLFQSSRLEIKPEAADALDKVFAAAARISLSTDAPLNFVQIKMQDHLTNATVTLWRYVPDIRDNMFYARMPMEEYFNRLVIEMSETTRTTEGDSTEVLWDPPITLPEFLAKQIVSRAKRDSLVGFQAHEDLTEPETLGVVIENWSSIDKENARQKTEIVESLEKAAKTVLEGYRFNGFHSLMLQDNRGMALRRWTL